MNLTPEQFIESILSGETERDLNKQVAPVILSKDVLKLIKFGHSAESAREHLSTDYSNGFTICRCCGSFYQLGEGFTKHLSNGCLNCEGIGKHHTYYHEGNNEREYKTSPRWMSVMFDDGMHYCKDKLQIERFKSYFQPVVGK